MTAVPLPKIVIVCEGPTDFRAVCALLAAAGVAPERHEFAVLDGSNDYLPWKRVGHIAANFRLKFHGRFKGAGEFESRQAIGVLNRTAPDAAIAILLRDSDGDEFRGEQAKAARDAQRSPFPVVVGVAHCMLEAWCLLVFRPGDEDETQRLRAIRQELGYDPTRQPWRLDAKPENAKGNPKRVLRKLSAGDANSPCLLALAELKPGSIPQDDKTGLRAFFDELSSLRSRVPAVFSP